MRNKRFLHGGYIGLLMLLIGVAITVFLIVRTDLFSGQKEGKSILKQDLEAVDKARDAKAMLERNDQRAVGEERR